MPTVIALDVSLSMLRPVPSLDASETSTRLSLACVGINTFLDYLQAQMKLEYVSLVTFSSICEVIQPFTRDFDMIRHKLPLLEEGDRTCFQTALSNINQLVLNEWGHQIPVQIIMITDGTAGVGPLGRARITESLPLPPCFPARLHFVTISTAQDNSLQYALPLYQTIIDQMSSCANANLQLPRGSVYSLDHLTVASVNTAMTKLTEQQYPPAVSTLKCGQLECRVQLFPPPARAHHCATPPATLMHIVGFISHQDLGTPITLSRHLIIPQSSASVTPASKDTYDHKSKDSASSEGNEDDMSDPSKIPNFCVLLHGALKVESMAAIVQIGEDWWGTVVAWCDSSRARRSCLLLSVLSPGPTAAPWLSHLGHLGPEDDSTSTDTFPIKCVRSYSGGGGAGGGVWSRTHALIADVQKVLRHARKLPDKTHHMYKLCMTPVVEITKKTMVTLCTFQILAISSLSSVYFELNRLRRMAISLGFRELLTHMAAILERECALLGGIGASEAALQLAHAAASLRDPATQTDIQHNLMPHKMAETTSH